MLYFFQQEVYQQFVDILLVEKILHFWLRMLLHFWLNNDYISGFYYDSGSKVIFSWVLALNCLKYTLTYSNPDTAHQSDTREWYFINLFSNLFTYKNDYKLTCTELNLCKLKNNQNRPGTVPNLLKCLSIFKNSAHSFELDETPGYSHMHNVHKYRKILWK